MNPVSDELFRQAAETEGGMPVSAGARVAHVQLALEAGRGIQIDLSGIPRQKRAEVIAEISEVVKRALASTNETSISSAR